MLHVKNRDVSLSRLKEMVIYLEKKLGRTSVLVKRLQEPLQNCSKTKSAAQTKNIYLSDDDYATVSYAKSPVMLFDSSQEEDPLNQQIIPPLPDLQELQPKEIEQILAGLNLRTGPPTISLPNGIPLTYGKILALAGNFYGLTDDSICISSDTATTATQRFEAAFNNLACQDSDILTPELDQLLEIMKIEKNSVETVLGFGNRDIPTVLDDNVKYKNPSDMYRIHGIWFTQQYDIIMGGKWKDGKPTKYGRVLKLAKNNLDNFQPYCLRVWKIGHMLAIEKAKEAGRRYGEVRNVGKVLLEEAYAISAFSCHFLLQSFFSGHIRVPRNQLQQCNLYNNIPSGYKLSYYHFNEDEKFGINVTNTLNERWACYGHNVFYDTNYRSQKDKMIKAIRDCVLQVFSAFSEPGYAGDCDAILNQVPEEDARMPNNFPLFKVSETGDVLRRRYVNDLSSAQTQGNWWTSSTLTSLKNKNAAPKKSALQL